MSTSATSIRRSEYFDDGSVEDLDLRAALRNVRILPAPTQVEDLLSRLDDKTVTTTSGDLAEIILDARYPDLLSWTPRSSREEFFEPITRVANANERQGGIFISRLVHGIFKTVVLGAALLIGWNALVRNDMDHSAPDLLSLRSESLAGPNVTTLSKSYPGAAVVVREDLPDTVTPLRLDLAEEAPPNVSPPLGALAGEERSRTNSSEIDPTTSAELLDEIAISAERVSSSQVREVDQDIDVESTRPETVDLGAYPDHDSRVERNEPAHALEYANETVIPARQEVGSPNLEPDAGVLASWSEPSLREASGHVAPPSEPALREVATPEAIAAVGGPTERLTRTFAANTPQGSRPASIVKHRPLRSAATIRMPFTGVWATSLEACSSEMQQEGHLLARISARQARAGDTVCTFRNTKPVGRAWHIAASCSDGETIWKSNVRLSLTRSGLSWTSHKGSTNYVRCPRGAGLR
jgi:hypothetical protein